MKLTIRLATAVVVVLIAAWSSNAQQSNNSADEKRVKQAVHDVSFSLRLKGREGTVPLQVNLRSSG